MNFNVFTLSLLALSSAIKCSEETEEKNSAQTIEFNLQCTVSSQSAGNTFKAETDVVLSKLANLYDCGMKNYNEDSFKNCIVALNLPDEYEEIFGDYSVYSFRNNYDFKNSIKMAAKMRCESLNASHSNPEASTYVVSSKGKLILITKKTKPIQYDVKSNEFTSHSNSTFWSLVGLAILVLAFFGGIFLYFRAKSKNLKRNEESTNVKEANTAVVDLTAPPAYDNFNTSATPAINFKQNENLSDDLSIE